MTQKTKDQSKAGSELMVSRTVVCSSCSTWTVNTYMLLVKMTNRLNLTYISKNVYVHVSKVKYFIMCWSNFKLSLSWSYSRWIYNSLCN